MHSPTNFFPLSATFAVYSQFRFCPELKGNNYFYWNVSKPITDFEIGLMKKQLNHLRSRHQPHLYGRTRRWSILERLCFTCCSSNLQLLLSSPLTYSVQPLEGNVSNAFNLSQVSWRRQTTQREMTKSQTVQIRRVRCLLICTVRRNQAVTFGEKNKHNFYFLAGFRNVVEFFCFFFLTCNSMSLMRLYQQCSTGRFVILKTDV